MKGRNDFLSLDPHALGTKPTYKVLIGTIVPRPIAFVSTQSANGFLNLAPFSFFNGVSSNPPCLMFSIARKADGSKKDTLVNIEETGQFVVNSANEWIASEVHQASAAYPYGVSEFEKIGLHSLPSTRVQPPRVAESAVQLECELYGKLEVGDGTVGSATIVVGKIVWIHVRSDVYDDGKVRLEVLKPIARLAGTSYCKTGETFSFPPATVQERTEA